MHNTPAAHICAQRNRSVGTKDDVPLVISPSGSELCGCETAACQQCPGDNAHGFLRVVTAMAQAIRCGGKKLKLAEKLIDGARRGVLENPGNGYHERESQDQTDQWGQDYKNQSRHPFFAKARNGADDRPM